MGFHPWFFCELIIFILWEKRKYVLFCFTFFYFYGGFVDCRVFIKGGTFGFIWKGKHMESRISCGSPFWGMSVDLIWVVKDLPYLFMFLVKNYLLSFFLSFFLSFLLLLLLLEFFPPARTDFFSLKCKWQLVFFKSPEGLFKRYLWIFLLLWSSWFQLYL